MPGAGVEVDPADATSTDEYVALLRRVRARSGLSYRSIARRAAAAGSPLPASTLATMLSRPTLPRRELVTALLTACEVPPAGQERWIAVWKRLSDPSAPDPATSTSDAVPFELPPPPPLLVGRDEELDRLVGGLSSGHAVWLLTGPGGIGKSALAVLAAHRSSHLFPDGCLYAELRGASAGPEPRDPLDVLGGFLRALGVRAAPGTVDEASALFRTVTAGRALLVVLDNAATAAQVRPLLPSGARCAVLVTSRWRLPDLDVGGRIPLEPLPPPAARTLLANLYGSRQLATENAAATEIVRRCGGSPLALRIVAARAAARPAPGALRALADRLADHALHLDALEIGDLSVRTSLQIGYRTFGASTDVVGSTAARVFRLAALPDWTDLSAPACAALVDMSVTSTERALERLIDAHLIEPVSVERFRYHDSVRIFALEQATAMDPPDVRVAAIRRVATAMFGAAAVAARALFPRDLLPYEPLCQVPQRLFGAGSTTAQAWRWLERERGNLRLIADQEFKAGRSLPEVRDLGLVLGKYLDYAGNVSDQVAFGELAVGAAQALGDRHATAAALNILAIAMLRRERLADGIALLKQLLTTRRQLDDRAGEAACLNNLGNAHRDAGDLDTALRCLQQALAIRRDLGDRYKTGSTLDNIAIVLRRMGRFTEALEHHRTALEVTRELGDRLREGLVLTNLAETEQMAGDHRRALDHAEQAYAVTMSLNHDHGRAQALRLLGDIHTALGEPARARACYDEAGKLAPDA